MPVLRENLSLTLALAASLVSAAALGAPAPPEAKALPAGQAKRAASGASEGRQDGLAPPLPARERIATAAFAIEKDPSGQKVAAAAGALLRAKIAASARLKIIEPGRVLSGDPRTREEEAIDRARAALADGRRSYDALSLDDAIARLGQAVSLYQQSGPLLGDMNELETALMYLGAALILRGSADEGASTFAELLTLNPSFAPGGFPPSVTRVFDQTVSRQNTAAAGTVEVYSTPPYAAVFIDGEYRGVTPATVTDLAPGTHYLRLEKDGYVVHGAPIDVSPRQRVTSQTRLTNIKRGAELRDLLARSSREIGADAMGGNLRALARMVVAEYLVVIGVSQSGNDATLVGVVYDAGTGTKLATERGVIGVDGASFRKDLEGLVDKVVAAAASSGAGATASPEGEGGGNESGFGLGASGGGGGAGGVAGGGGAASGGASGAPADGSVTGEGATVAPVTGEVTPEKPTKVGTIVGWCLVGAGGLSMGTGLVFGILAQKTHSDYRNTPQASPDLISIRDNGKTFSLVADITLIAGAAVAVAGGVTLLITHRSQPSTAELLGSPRAALVPIEGGAMVAFGADLP